MKTYKCTLRKSTKQTLSNPLMRNEVAIVAWAAQVKQCTVEPCVDMLEISLFGQLILKKYHFEHS